ncbi:interleukin-17 receptor A isoform X2 [Engraulis encrasicolus]|uniref:interleukin-17 receptor A isoform X2 n=1 Tax=Engraulis encrasicolus TaxID=184585 RepID=UPI002FD0322A
MATLCPCCVCTGEHRLTWSFTSDSVGVEPGCQYSISFSHLPKLLTSFETKTITHTISIPDCSNPKIKACERCSRHGSLWQPNITWSESQRGLNQLDISASFDGWIHADEYELMINDTHFPEPRTMIIPKSEDLQKRLNANFTLDLLWLIQSNKSCQLAIKVTPKSGQCIKACVDHWEKINICNYTTPLLRKRLFWFVPVQVLVMLAAGYLGVLLRRCCHPDVSMTQHSMTQHHKTANYQSSPAKKIPAQKTATQRILILYSLDHPLYKEIILKLCAFLRAKCGAEVTLDLLDSAWLSTVGQLQWLEMQMQQRSDGPHGSFSNDKILILCSRGVMAKWRAMCSGGAGGGSHDGGGGGSSGNRGCSSDGVYRVTLREDLASPAGDMFTPALALIVPDFVRSKSLERYMVAYFEDVSDEADVPLLFHVTVRYQLMRHFEQLLFRILGQEQQEPGTVKRIYGIAEEDYFHCPAGRALRDAIAAFRAYQQENPDWFRQELVCDPEETVDSGLDCQPQEKPVHGYIQESLENEADSALTASVLTQNLSHASFSVDYAHLYPSVNQVAFTGSPKLTESLLCCQGFTFSEHKQQLLIAHSTDSVTVEEECEEPYWSAGHASECEEHLRQNQLNCTDKEDGWFCYEPQQHDAKPSAVSCQKSVSWRGVGEVQMCRPILLK